MRQYEVTFIVDPVLSGDEVKQTVKTYSDYLTENGCELVHTDEMGLRQLAYPINKKNTGFYYCIEYKTPTGAVIEKMELLFRRDERILRFLSVALEKYGIKYNEDKRNGLIKKVERKKVEEPKDDRRDRRGGRGRGPRRSDRGPRGGNR